MLIFNGVWAIAKGMNSCQCFGRVSRPAASSFLYRGVAGSGVINPKIGSPGGQLRISFRVRSATPGVSLSMPKINEVMAKTLRCASRSSTTEYSPGLLNPFFTSARLAGSMDSIPMKIHLPPAAAIRSTSSSSRSRLALICATQCTCAFAAMMSRSNDFVRFTLMAKLSSMKKTAIWPPSPRALQERMQKARKYIELLQLDLVPGNLRIRPKRRFVFLAKFVHWRVDILQCATHGIFYDSRPCLIGFAKSNGVGMAGSTVSPERLIGHFRNVRTAHHYLYSGSAHRVRHAISLGDHPGHRTDAHQPDILFTHVARDAFFIHGLRVAINQHHFVTRWSQ